MIAHVAEASELSGRVVLWLDPEANYPAARLEAPVRLAAAYGAEIETVVVSDGSAGEAEGVPVRMVGQAARGVQGGFVEHERRFELLMTRCRRAVDEVGAAHGVKVRHTLASGDAVDRISEMCDERGPWNIVALARMPTTRSDSVIGTLLANVSGATGFLLCGEQRSKQSRVVVIVEDAERLPSMLRAAERLSAPKAPVHIVIGADTADDYAEIEGQSRLLVSETSLPIIFEEAGPTFGVPGALTEFIARLKPSLTIAVFGGSALADGRELARASVVARTPILLVR
ncbi:hypothetical protein [Hyphomicrobium sp. 2TAF46]|uniref:hypothetical protein n=1 Tax=Hyphomicrobium sp. 2TAF46 TaxID=3233019 RepID=UPI003F8F3402